MSSGGYVAEAAIDGCALNFLRRVMHEVFEAGILTFQVCPAVWSQVAVESDYGTRPGTRCSGQDIELLGPQGWCAVEAVLCDEGQGSVVVDSLSVGLDFQAVLV